ncbi:MAG: hypothetical protein JWR69_1285 [Pedosphaera sp.]|nr:hypothetical protein [Pedosphaera sp.]
MSIKQRVSMFLGYTHENPVTMIAVVLRPSRWLCWSSFSSMACGTGAKENNNMTWFDVGNELILVCFLAHVCAP